MDILSYIGIVICIMFSAFFSASEISYASVNKMRLKSKAETGDRRARVALYIAENFNDALSTILIGNNLVNIAASSISTVIVINLMGERGTIVSTLVMTVVILIFGEITPKIVGKKISDKYVLIAAYPLRILTIALSPVIKLVVFVVNLLSKLWKTDDEAPTITEEELFTIIESVEDDGIIDKDRSDLLQSALEFSKISVMEIITPRIEMTTIDIDDDIYTIIDTVLDTPYSRIPVYEYTVDNIIGVLYVDHLLDILTEIEDVKYIDLKSILIDTCFIHKTMKLPEVFTKLNNGKLQMAIVTDEYGGTMGCITMEDILEELVGEIWDENDEIYNDFIEITDCTYEINAEINLRDFAEYLDFDEEHFESEYSTVGGWVIENFNRLPNIGDTFKYERLMVKVIELDGLRVSRILVKDLEMTGEAS